MLCILHFKTVYLYLKCKFAGLIMARSLHRSATTVIERALRDYPAVVILGSRQVGKTTLAKQIATKRKGGWVYLDLESPSDVARLSDAEAYLGSLQDRLVVIDEVQRMPELFPVLRSLIDKKRRAGRFLLLGSSSPEVVQRTSESLAGRVAYLDLMPFHIGEVGADKTDRLWLRGGYPDIFLTRSNATAFDRAGHFVRTFMERDLPQLGLSADPRITERLLRMVASVHGQVLNASMLAKSLGITVHTVQRYLAFFEQAYLITLLPSHHVNLRKRLVKAPKVYVLDSGLLHAVSGIQDRHQLAGHALRGHSWEGFVIQQVRARYRRQVDLCYFRTQDGSELDLVLLRGGTPLAAIEIKATDVAVLSKGNRLAYDAVGAAKNLIVTPSAEDHPHGNGVQVCSLATLFTHLDKLAR